MYRVLILCVNLWLNAVFLLSYFDLFYDSKLHEPQLHVSFFFNYIESIQFETNRVISRKFKTQFEATETEQHTFVKSQFQF